MGLHKSDGLILSLSRWIAGIAFAGIAFPGIALDSMHCITHANHAR